MLVAVSQEALPSDWGQLGRAPGNSCHPEEVEERLKDTIEAWRSWSRQHQRDQGPWRELVDLSGPVLQGLLTFQRTRAIVAAATASVAEVVGGGVHLGLPLRLIA